jgi:hypothetical protein
VLIGLAAVALLYLNGRIAGTGRRDRPSGHQYASQPTATMEEQRRANAFLHFEDPDEFVVFRAEHNEHRLPPLWARAKSCKCMVTTIPVGCATRSWPVRTATGRNEGRSTSGCLQ